MAAKGLGPAGGRRGACPLSTWQCPAWQERPPRGGGVLSLEKGTDFSPTAGEWWLSRPAMAKKGGLSLYFIVGKGSC